MITVTDQRFFILAEAITDSILFFLIQMNTRTVDPSPKKQIVSYSESVNLNDFIDFEASL